MPCARKVAQTEGIVTLGETFADAVRNQRQMAEFRRRQLQDAIEKQLAKSRAEQVRAAHDFGDPLGGVVDHDGELVGRNVVLSPNDEIAKVEAGDGPLQPGALVEKLHRFVLRNAKSPVHAGRIFRCGNR